MAEEKTTVKGLNKAIQSIYDKLSLRIDTIEKQAETAEKQKTCEHEYITTEISSMGGLHNSKCAECGKVFLTDLQFESTGASRKYGKKIHEYLIKQKPIR